jgi:hypothetical protein
MRSTRDRTLREKHIKTHRIADVDPVKDIGHANVPLITWKEVHIYTCNWITNIARVC